MLLHTSFCGSTLLSGYIQSSSTVLVYREPAILSELAALKADAHKLSQRRGQWRALIAFACGQLQKSWGHVPTLVKPSSRANTLLPDLLAQDHNQYTLRLSQSVEEYLLANLRGGQERQSYSLKMLDHLQKTGCVNAADVQNIERGNHSQTGRLLRLLSLLHDAQMSLLEENLPDADGVTLSDMTYDPKQSVVRAGRSLGLSVDQAWAEQAVVKLARQNAQNPGSRFDLKLEKTQNLRLRAELSAEFDGLSAWRDNQMRDVG